MPVKLRAEHVVALALVALALTVAGTASAQAVDSATLDISVEIDTSCTVSAEPLDFGSLAPVSGTFPGEGTVTVTCPDQLQYLIRLDFGDHPLNVTRQVQNEDGDEIPYFFYQDRARTQPWGEGNIDPMRSAVGTGSAQTHTVYGDLEIPDDVPGGRYTDTVIVAIFL